MKTSHVQKFSWDKGIILLINMSNNYRNACWFNENVFQRVTDNPVYFWLTAEHYSIICSLCEKISLLKTINLFYSIYERLKKDKGQFFCNYKLNFFSFIDRVPYFHILLKNLVSPMMQIQQLLSSFSPCHHFGHRLH